jgi:hypothetical protein
MDKDLIDVKNLLTTTMRMMRIKHGSPLTRTIYLSTISNSLRCSMNKSTPDRTTSTAVLV